MEEHVVRAERVWVDTNRTFDEVLESIGQHVSRPNMSEFMGKTASAHNFEEISEIVRQTVGPAGLMEFVRFPLGAFAQHDPEATRPKKMIRLLLGNPVIMESMSRHVPEVGSYAPVTLLIFEQNGKVRLRYDRLASFIAPYGSPEASQIARGLDEKIIGILKEVA